MQDVGIWRGLACKKYNKKNNYYNNSNHDQKKNLIYLKKKKFKVIIKINLNMVQTKKKRQEVNHYLIWPLNNTSTVNLK